MSKYSTSDQFIVFKNIFSDKIDRKMVLSINKYMKMALAGYILTKNDISFAGRTVPDFDKEVLVVTINYSDISSGGKSGFTKEENTNVFVDAAPVVTKIESIVKLIGSSDSIVEKFKEKEQFAKVREIMKKTFKVGRLIDAEDENFAALIVTKDEYDQYEKAFNTAKKRWVVVCVVNEIDDELELHFRGKSYPVINSISKIHTGSVVQSMKSFSRMF